MSQQPLAAQHSLDMNSFSTLAQRIFVLCFAVIVLDGFDTAAIGFIAPSLIKEWGVSKPALAPVLSAALFGLAAGALVAGPLADRIGRKVVLAWSVGLFGIASFASAFVANIDQLTVLRAITGLGLGAALPNAVTMVSEYCPAERRAILTNAMFCGFPVGAAAGGFLASFMIPRWGFRSVLGLGGVIPLVLAVLIALLLPESLRYLLAKAKTDSRARERLERMAPAAALAAPEPPAAHSGIGVLLSGPYLVGSLMLWIAYFSGLVIFYALINWLPVLLRESGLNAQNATLISALFPVGGIGAVYSGWLMDRFNANRIVAIFYGLTAVSLVLLGKVGDNTALLVLLVLVAGILMNTAQSSLPALAATFYPTEGRATGVAWMMGVGRFGGIVGSLMVAELTRQQLGLPAIFMAIAAPGAVGCIALFVKQFAERAKAAAAGLVKGAIT